MNCDSGVVEIITAFSVGGIGLRVAIAQIRKKLNVTGFLAIAVTLACCAAASAVYILLQQGDWNCLLTYTTGVFTATQVAYRVTHK